MNLNLKNKKCFDTVRSNTKKTVLSVVFCMAFVVSESFAQEMALKTNLLYDLTTTINLGYEVALDNKTTLDVWVNYNPWTLGHKWVGIKNAPAEYVERRETKLKHFMIQPEVRFWLCEKFNGSYFGVHLHGGIYDVGALAMPFGWGRYKDASGEYLGTENQEMVNSDGKTVTGVQYNGGTDPYQGMVDKFGEDYAKNHVLYSNADRDGIYTNSFEGWFAGAGVSYGYHLVVSPRFSMDFTLGVGYSYFQYEKTRCTDCRQVIAEEESHYFGPTRLGVSLVYMLK